MYGIPKIQKRKGLLVEIVIDEIITEEEVITFVNFGWKESKGNFIGACYGIGTNPSGRTIRCTYEKKFYFSKSTLKEIAEDSLIQLYEEKGYKILSFYTVT